MSGDNVLKQETKTWPRIRKEERICPAPDKAFQRPYFILYFFPFYLSIFFSLLITLVLFCVYISISSYDLAGCVTARRILLPTFVNYMLRTVENWHRIAACYQVFCINWSRLTLLDAFPLAKDLVFILTVAVTKFGIGTV